MENVRDDSVADPSDTQGMPGSDFAEYVPITDLTKFEQDDEIERIYRQADPETSARILRVAWPGADYETNVEFAQQMMTAIPGSVEVLRVLEAAGIGDSPDILKWLASAGRLMAGVPGDPTTLPTTTTGQTQGAR